MASKYRSDALEVAHRTATNLFRLGLIDRATMREFDVASLILVEELTPREIENMRKREGVSRGVFAGYLNVPESFIREWETGARKPTGPALRLLSVVKSKGLAAIL